MFWLNERIESWKDATTLNGVNILKIATPSSLVGKFCAGLNLVP